MMIAQRTTAVASRTGLMQQIREFSTPKLHKAKGNWDALKAKRPIDHDDLHVRFNFFFFLNNLRWPAAVAVVAAAILFP